MRAIVVGAVVMTSATAHGYAVGPAVPLDKLVEKADLVCKATVTADKRVVDSDLPEIPLWSARETTFKVISCLKGRKPATFKFRHYGDAPTVAVGMGSGYTPSHYNFVVGSSYIVFAKRGPSGVYRTLDKAPTQRRNADAILAGDDKPHRGKTIKEATLAELSLLVLDKDKTHAIEGVQLFHELSGGSFGRGLDLYARGLAMSQVALALANPDDEVATAALDVLGEDSPYYANRDIGYWFAAIPHAAGISGLAPRKPRTPADASHTGSALFAIIDSQRPVALRAKALRAAGTVPFPPGKLATLARDPEAAIRASAILVAAKVEAPLVVAGVKDSDATVRTAAAFAIGLAQDPALLPQLTKLLTDPAPEVTKAAAMSLLAFPLDKSKATLAANLTGDWRSVFVMPLARQDPKPHLALLAEIVVKHEQPKAWWGGTMPAADAWRLLYQYVKSLPEADLAAGKADATLDALEKMQWFSSSEPRDLYALYLVRKLPARAAKFRAAMKGSALNLDYFFGEADKHPQQFVQP